MKKKQLANLIMVAIILIITTAGILTVGHIQGWFDHADDTCATVTDIRGVVNLERNGVMFPASNAMVLRDGDRIVCNPGATATLLLGDDYLVLSDKADITLSTASADTFSAEIINGELFIHTTKQMTFSFEESQITIADAVASLSVHTGSQSVNVYYGIVETAIAGQMITYLSGETEIQELSISTLNNFFINQIRKANKTTELCFSNADLDRLITDRNQALQEIINGTKPSETESTETPTTPETTEPTEEKLSCAITIRCDSILNNWADLEPGKAEFVPEDGVILYPVTVYYEEGETVFDVLNRVCSQLNIQIEYSYTPLYESYYIEGINHLYEFDCGEQSGWMYKVNGWFPNYGCSSYHPEDGDVIEWIYTCKGLGADVGQDAN